MKLSLLSLLTAFSLLAAGTAAAQDRRDQNYGYDKNHKVTPQERARWEAQHKNDRRDDKNDRHDDKNNRRDQNYGYDKNHKVTPQERARWEAQHKNDHR